MKTHAQLNAILEEWDLLKHPFYRSWSEGTLPITALKVYADEYGKFIAMMPDGWTTLSDLETAQEEREHAELWEQFSAALGDSSDNGNLDQGIRLVNTAQDLFGSRPKALGALYAFEAQQPATATSKLTGLKEHYNLPVEVEPYFEEHTSNWHESEKLHAQIDALPVNEQGSAVQACQEMASALWDALTDIHTATC